MTGLRLLDVRQVAEILGIAVRTVWRLSAAGELPPPVRIGVRIVRWRLSDIEQYLENLAKTGG